MNPKKTERDPAIDRVLARRVDDPELLLDQLRYFRRRRATLDFIIADLERRLASLTGRSSTGRGNTSH